MNSQILSSVVALAFCSTLFAGPKAGEKKSIVSDTCFYQGEMLEDNRYQPAYNAPAKIDLHNRQCKWPYHVFVDASFIYWYASQDGMGLATSADLATSNAVVFNQQSTSLIQHFKYSPGFKVGLGMGVQEWELHAEYTWVRQKTSVNSNAPTNHTNGGTNIPVWLISNWFAQGIGQFGQYVSATHISSSWHLGIDLLDVTGGRPFYQSKNLTISPYGGVRTAWIRQSLRIAATVPAQAVSGTLAPQPIFSHNHSNSWGIGPVFGASAHCLLGAGFRVEGEGGMSILFTQYTTLSHKENVATTGTTLSVIRALSKNYNCARPAANLGLGLGWGKYLYNGRYHLDFSADYEFNAFWDQNMMRTFIEEFSTTHQPSNDLFLHGLTVTGRFDF